MTTSPSPSAARRGAPARHAPALALAAILLAPTLLVLAGCGQQGPLRHPWETTTEGRDNAAARRLPTGARTDLPTAVDDASSTQVRP